MDDTFHDRVYADILLIAGRGRRPHRPGSTAREYVEERPRDGRLSRCWGCRNEHHDAAGRADRSGWAPPR